jgi:hypothetical protein
MRHRIEGIEESLVGIQTYAVRPCRMRRSSIPCPWSGLAAQCQHHSQREPLSKSTLLRRMKGAKTRGCTTTSQKRVYEVKDELCHIYVENKNYLLAPQPA